MTIEEFVAKYDGKYVADGQCGNLVRAYWNEVDHTTPPSYDDSKDYWFNPVPGYDKVSSPRKGDIAIYDGHGIYTAGHSAIYYDGRVFEQNADPDGSPAHLFNRVNAYLLGYLRKQGATMSVWDKGKTNNLLFNGLGRSAKAKEIADYALANGNFGGENGKQDFDAMNTIINSAEYQNYVKQVQASLSNGNCTIDERAFLDTMYKVVTKKG